MNTQTHELQYEPRLISMDELEREWPLVSVKVVQGETVVEKVGRVVGRTLAKSPHYDIRLDDGTILLNRPASEVANAEKIKRKLREGETQ